ncbi:MAG: hypothetical protein KC609_25380 [Myxococcales bacterium]|nr:hypothetical protein [Myxococcales bacterium]
MRTIRTTWWALVGLFVGAVILALSFVGGGRPAAARTVVRPMPGTTLGDGRSVLLENRDGRSYRWRLRCRSGDLAGSIDSDGVVRFQPRGTSWSGCSLGLEGTKLRVAVAPGERLLIRNGRLTNVRVQTVLFPPLEVFGDVSLARNKKLKRQWASNARASTEYSRPAWSALQATGPANVSTCSDNRNAWAPKPQNAGREWLALDFPRKVRALGALIHVSLNPGAIVEIQAKTGSGWARVWRGTDRSLGHCPSVLAIRFQEPVDTSSIRIILDTRQVRGWNEIDAVQLLSRN